MFSRYDILIWIIIVALALGGMFYYYNIASSGEHFVSISVNSIEFEPIPLTESNNNFRKEIEGINGLTIIEILDQRVRVISSACPDKLCVHSGWIDKPGQLLVCLPNKVVVRIISDEQQDIDFYTN
ncbi:NusG domain II-containing protein [Candidatus Contubernalis alkaliaceticus]|uniref:NusG domain II-containing protein n=1 Tax=Candidatus Contubernalis alkaliaceticus TaxID=338645 RepID=UPI001F4C1E8F|nr:NusG domain II-containing protein [Candidatus Contubernalis alkalaceticus]UNC90915.1 NusG domain II-containing protein [Candidatus Contubernalis alkalaceticus]